MTTRNTSEIQTLSIGTVNIPTFWAASTRVLGTDELNSNALRLKLVGHQKQKSTMRPSINLITSILFLTLGGFLYASTVEVLKHNSLSTDFVAEPSQGIRCDMQHMSRYGSLFSRKSLKELSGRSSTNGLNFGPYQSDAFSEVIEFPSLVEEGLIVRGSSNENSIGTKVNADYCARGFGFRDVYLVAQKEIRDSFDDLELGVFPTFYWEPWMLDVDRLGPEGDLFFGFSEVTLPNERDSDFFEDGFFPSLVGLSCSIGGGYLFAYTTGELRGELEFLSQGGIVGLGDSVGVEFFGFVNDIGEPVDGTKVVPGYGMDFRATREFEFDCA